MADNPFRKNRIKIEKALRKASLETSKAVINATPIRSGFLVNSWQAQTTDRAFRGIFPRPAGYNNPSRSAALGRVKAIANKVVIRNNVSFALYNTAEYAEKVESGESSKRGKGMLRDNVKMFKTVFLTAARA